MRHNMTDSPREATEKAKLEGLRERWQDFDVHVCWWGILVVPKGTPVITAPFAESAEAQLERMTSDGVATQAANQRERATITFVNTSDPDTCRVERIAAREEDQHDT